MFSLCLAAVSRLTVESVCELHTWLPSFHTHTRNQVSEMKAVEQRKTPLQVSMDDLGQRLSVMSFAVIGCIALIGACC